MAFPQAEKGRRHVRHALGVAALVCGLSAIPAPAPAEETPPVVAPQQAPAPSPSPLPGATEAVDSSLSPECRVPGSKMYTLARLAAVKTALKERRPIRVLSVGSSSSGLGPSASYPVRLESALERSLPNVDVQIESRGLPGEIASGAGERLRNTVADVEPDVVVWQVGTNDALARVDPDEFAEGLSDTVQWIKSHGIDVVLVDPLFTQSVAQDASYGDLVKKVQEVAKREGVPLVRRYEAMRFLSAGGDKDGKDGETHMLGRHFRLNDLGLRCLAEHVTRAITLSLLQPDAAAATQGVTREPPAAAPGGPAEPGKPEGETPGGP